MEDVQKFSGMNTLSYGGLRKSWQDTVGFKAAVGAGAEADLPEYDHLSQGLFGMIISRLDIGDAQKGSEMFLLRAYEEASQRLSRFELKSSFANIAQLQDEALFDICRLRPRDLTGFQFSRRMAGA